MKNPFFKNVGPYSIDKLLKKVGVKNSRDYKKDKITVDMKKIQRDKSYTYWCSFPGHINMMRGGFQVQGGSTISVRDQTKVTKG